MCGNVQVDVLVCFFIALESPFNAIIVLLCLFNFNFMLSVVYMTILNGDSIFHIFQSTKFLFPLRTFSPSVSFFTPVNC